MSNPNIIRRNYTVATCDRCQDSDVLCLVVGDSCVCDSCVTIADIESMKPRDINDTLSRLNALYAFRQKRGNPEDVEWLAE